MKKTLSAAVVIAALVPVAWAQDRIYRCGNEYTNNATQARERGCKLVEGGNVTVVQGAGAGGAAARPNPAPAGGGATATASPAGAPKVASNDQKARDADARAILETELRKAEGRHAELLKEFKNGEPDRSALELRNPQAYQERLAELKANIARSENDVAGIRRELGRLPSRP